MAKKRRTAKQKAATRKLVKMNKAKKKKKAPKRRKKTTKRRKSSKPKKKSNKKNKPRKKSMVKGLGKITSNPTLKKVLIAAGAVSVATSVAAVAFPSLVPTIQRPIVKAALGFVTGDFIGAASNFLLGGGAGQITGRMNGSQNGGTGGNAGFA